MLTSVIMNDIKISGNKGFRRRKGLFFAAVSESRVLKRINGWGES